MIYGVTLRGNDADIEAFSQRVNAKALKLTSEKADVPIHPEIMVREIEMQEGVPLENSSDLSRAVDYCPSSGHVDTYRDTGGWSTIYNSMKWNALNKAQFSTDSGYEHDFVLYNYDGQYWADGLRGTLRGTGWDSNLPYAYLDYATIDDNPQEPIFTVGTFKATDIEPGTSYYSWLKAYPGNASVDTAKLVGQKTRVDAYSVWLVFVQESIFIVGNWGISVPGTYYWSR